MKSQELYKKALFSELKNLETSDIYKIGALVFSGDHKQARRLADQNESQHSLEDRVFIQFHLGISYTRTSQYKKAAQLFKNNLLLLKEHSLSIESQFLSYQGIGFFNYFFARHKRSLQATYHAHKCLHKLSKEQANPLYQILCLDLEGHNLIHRLRIHQGIETLEQALTIAKKHKMKAFETSLTFSLLLYKSRFSLNLEESLSSLKKAYSELSPEDDYSLAELVFEISNLFMLNGDFKEAQLFLEENYKVVYKNDNQRQMGQLNFRMTYILYKQGAFQQALYLAKTARSNLKSMTDKSLMSQILGLEIKILKAMGDSTNLLEQELKELDKQINSSLINRRNSLALNTKDLFNKGEDSLGDLIELIKTDSSKQTYSNLIKHQLFGLLGDFFKIEPGRECIVTNAPFNHTIILKKNRVHVIEKSLGNLSHKLLSALTTHQATKEYLITTVWNYADYDPSRHDHLIYSSITRLRALLHLDEHQLVFDGNHYKLNITVLKLSEETIQKVKPLPLEEAIPSTIRAYDHLSEDLNHRQIKTLEDRQINEVSVKKYASLYQITTMTALRDLKKLCELGHLKRFGKGRATTYLKNHQK